MNTITCPKCHGYVPGHASGAVDVCECPPLRKPAPKLKWFHATIESACLECAMDLPGWSHCGPEFDRTVLWYPWTAQFRRIYFKARHRTQAAKHCDRAGLLVRDLSDGH